MKLNKNEILSYYKKLYKIRETELRISKEYIHQEMRCPVHLSIGQEAVAAAFSKCVKKGDYAVSSHRAHAHYLAKGGNLKSLISELYGKKTGCSHGKGGSMHLIDLSVNFMGSTAIVANSIPIGVGLGLTSKIKNKKNISFVFFGEGATEEGVFFESINFAALKNLPIIFICENNLYSVYSPLKVRQPNNRKLSKMVNSLSIDSYSEDGNDVIKVYKILKNSINKVRKNNKPMFIEFKTYRHLEHCGPNIDNHLNYRSIKEVDYWLKNDPIKKLHSKIINKKHLVSIEKEIMLEIDNAFKYAKKQKFPNKIDAYRGVYKQ